EEEQPRQTCVVTALGGTTYSTPCCTAQHWAVQPTVHPAVQPSTGRYNLQYTLLYSPALGCTPYSTPCCTPYSTPCCTAQHWVVQPTQYTLLYSPALGCSLG
ncbi:hypothetical protein NHX12_012406, partial [Muraenolepis orangiensis]